MFLVGIITCCSLSAILLRAVHEDYAIMALSETWLDDSIANERLKINGYEIERNDRNLRSVPAISTIFLFLPLAQ
jgi:hypothetical protein